MINFHISDMSSDEDIANAICYAHCFIWIGRSEETQPHMKLASVFLQRNDVDTPVSPVPPQVESVLPCACAYDDPA